MDKFTLDNPPFLWYTIRMKMNVTLTPHTSATRRTRNRIREHGSTFRAERSSASVHGLAGLCWLVRASDGWMGWLPRNEFNWQHVDKLTLDR